MENKDAHETPNQSQTTNYVTSNGPNYGIVTGSIGNVNMPVPKPQEEDLPADDTAEKGIWKSTVVDLVSKGQTKEALAEILKTKPSEEFRNQVAMLSGRFSHLELERIAGIIDKEKELLELNNIRNGILTLVSRF